MTRPVEDSRDSRTPAVPVPGEAGSSSAEANPAPTLLDPISTLDRIPSCPVVVELPQVSGYEVLARIGQGGMGVVFRARDLGLGRHVALKMIRDGLLATPAHVARFQAEARAVARLQHPNIVQIFHVDEHQGRPYFALELVEGGNLAQYLNKHHLAPTDAAALVETLARAMQHAHDAGIVHRDLKPANVLLEPQAPLVPKITDFGLAKELEAELFLSHSGSATVIGTPSYMAPEQAWGPPGAVGAAADVYSLGAILYECLTGTPPFVAGTLLEVLDQVRSREPVPPRKLNPRLPRDLEVICLTCLHKQPERRYASAADLADDLGRFQRGEPIRARAVSTVERAWKWMRRRPALAAMTATVLVTITLAVLGAWHASSWAAQQRAAARADVARANYPTLLQQAQQALTQHRRDTARRLLDDCPLDVRGWEWHLLSAQADGHTPPRFVGLKQPVQALAFDHQRRHLYAATETGLRAWDQETLQELPTLDTGGRVKSLTISPDGRYLAALVESAVQPAPANLLFPPALQWFAPVPQLLRVAPVVRAGVVGCCALVMPGCDIAQVAPVPVPQQAPVPPTVFVVPGRHDEVRVWHLDSRRLVVRWDCPSGLGLQAPVRLAFQPGGNELAVLTSARAALRPAGGADRLFADPETDFVCCGAMIPEPAAGELPQEFPSMVAFLDLTDPRRKPRKVYLPGSECRSLAYSPDGSRLVLGSERGQVRLLDPVTGRLLATWTGPAGGTVISLAFDASGRKVAAGTLEGHVDLWNSRTGELLHLLPGHSAPVRELHFHPHEVRLLSLAADGHLKLWHLDSGQALTTLRIGSGTYHPAMSVDGRGEVVAVASPVDGQGNHGLTLLGMRSAGMPLAWQNPSADPTGFAQRRPPTPEQPKAAVQWGGGLPRPVTP